jgi:hypothetical protein
MALLLANQNWLERLSALEWVAPSVLGMVPKSEARMSGFVLAYLSTTVRELALVSVLSRLSETLSVARLSGLALGVRLSDPAMGLRLLVGLLDLGSSVGMLGPRSATLTVEKSDQLSVLMSGSTWAQRLRPWVSQMLKHGLAQALLDRVMVD